AFARRHDRPGMGVYDCVSPLKERRRAKSAVAEIPGLHWDIDARHVGEPKEQIIEKAREKLQSFKLLSRLTDSGRGVHVYIDFREPIEAGTPEADKAPCSPCLNACDRVIYRQADGQMWQECGRPQSPIDRPNDLSRAPNAALEIRPSGRTPRG